MDESGAVVEQGVGVEVAEGLLRVKALLTQIANGMLVDDDPGGLTVAIHPIGAHAHEGHFEHFG